MSTARTDCPYATCPPPWRYTGDVSPEHGGAWIDVSTWKDGYCSAVRVTDLDSGIGFRGAVLIEHVTLHGMDRPKDLRGAMRYCGLSCRGMGQQTARLALAEALLSYGCYEPDDECGHVYGRTPWSETVQLEPDGPMVWDGWRATKRLRGTTLLAYLLSVHLKG